MDGKRKRRAAAPLDRDGREFAGRWHGLMVELCRPWQARNPSVRDEIESNAHLALVELAAARDQVRDIPAMLNWRVAKAARRAIFAARPLGYRVSGGGVTVGPIPAACEAASRDDPAAEAEGRDLKRWVAARLSPRQAAAFEAVVFDGASYQEAGADLGIGYGTVRTHMQRAYASMRSEMGDKGVA